MTRSGAVLVAALLIEGSMRAQNPALASKPTFYKDISPIIDARCVSCHRPGGIGPFSLATYRDVQRRAQIIGAVVSRRIMPPWKVDGPSGDFAGRRVLSDAEIAVITTWIAQGAREGNVRDRPPLRQWATGWQLGTPELVVTMPDPYALPAGGSDAFRTFVLPIPVAAGRYVKAIEFRPGNPRVVHHANIGIDRSRSSRYLDSRDPEPGYSGGMVPEAGYPEGYMLGYTPGQMPHAEPDDMAWRLETGSDLVVQLHMQPTGKPEPVQVSVGFYFTDAPPRRTPVGLRLGSQTIDIAPGQAVYTIEDSYRLPVDVDVYAVQPHAHYLGRRLDASATLPDGTVQPLISISDWDFRWQDVYRWVTPLVLPRGTVVSMRYVYDNSAGNPRNPSQPAKRVVWGPNTSDEMGDLWLQLVPRTDSDLPALRGDVARKMRIDDLAAANKLLQDDPRNPLRHDAVALLQMQSGRIDEAIDHLRESLALNPASAPAHYNLAAAYVTRGRFDAALAELVEALRLNPDYPEAHNNAGAVLLSMGREQEALGHFERALVLKPDDVDVRNNLARTLARQGRVREAIDQFREAMKRRPDWPPALSGLAWIEATSSQPAFANPEEAVRLAERANALTGGTDPLILDVLAASYAAVGFFDRAVAAATAAARLAPARAPALTAEINERLALYSRGIPYRVPE